VGAKYYKDLKYEPGWRSWYSDWLRAGRPRGRSWGHGRMKNFVFSTSRTAVEHIKPPIQWVPAALSPEVKRPGREAGYLPTSAKVKNTWIYTSTPPHIFMA
jgi:hypothetical protein